MRQDEHQDQPRPGAITPNTPRQTIPGETTMERIIRMTYPDMVIQDEVEETPQWTVRVTPTQDVTEEELDQSLEVITNTEPIPTGIAVSEFSRSTLAGEPIRYTHVTSQPQPAIAPPPPSDPFIVCPECLENIRSVRFSCDTTGREFGSVSIGPAGLEDFETEDSDTRDQDNYEYRCCECDHLLEESWIDENIQGVTVTPTPPPNNRRIEREVNPLQFLQGHYGPIGGARFHSQLNKEQRELAEGQKPVDDARDIITSKQTGDEQRADEMMYSSLECPECHTLFHCPERNSMRFDGGSHRNETIRLTYQACPNCGTEFSLKEQRQ